MAYPVLVVSALFLEIVLNLPVGTMPLALTADGASHAVVAITMGTGMFTALLASLPIGMLVDRIGRLATMRIAAGVGIVTLCSMSFAHGPLACGVLLGIRSVAFIAYMTAEFAYASDLAPGGRAVSGVATLGMIGNLAFALGPALGVLLWQHGVGREQFAYGSAVALVGFAVLFALPKKFDRRVATRAPGGTFDRRWLPACGVALTCTLQGGVNGALAVLTFHERGIANGATIFTASALASFALRYPSGRLVDRFGPRRVAPGVVAVQLVGCLLAASAHSFVAVAIAGAVLGVAWAAVVPVSLGLLFEHGGLDRRGAAMGAYNLAFSGGAACGALLATGATLAGPGYPLAIVVCAFAPLVVLPAVLRSRPPATAPGHRRDGAGALAVAGGLGD